jgi:hypothetical protein
VGDELMAETDEKFEEFKGSLSPKHLGEHEVNPKKIQEAYFTVSF